MAEVKNGLEGDLYVYSGTTALSGTIAITGTRLAYCEGVGWNWDETVTDVWDRGTFSHWKVGRGKGELTIPTAYVDNMLLWDALDAIVGGSTAPRLQAEIRQYGTAGALEHTVQFANISPNKHFEWKEAEGDGNDTSSRSFDLATRPEHGTGSRIG